MRPRSCLLMLTLTLGVLTSRTPLRAADDPGDLVALKHSIVHGYAEIAFAAYADSLSASRMLADEVDAFLAAPSGDGLTRAKQAWLDARVPYTQTEAFRFYDGPIDAVEGFINSWPIDENLIDYVSEEPDAGIVNQTTTFPRIDGALLLSLNEKDGEKNITTGFHAIEFLLWGQDLDDEGPGHRSYLDYVDGHAPHADRRRDYLRLTSHLLVEHLARVVDEWAPGRPSNFRARLVAMPPDDALTCLLKGLGILSGSELAGERLTVAYDTKEQEDEHSCFSDNTHADIVHDTVGIQNVFRGHYTRAHGDPIDVAGLRSLLLRVDPALAATLSRQIDASVTAAAQIPPPFDRAILGLDTAPGRVAIKRLIDALRAQADSMARAGAVLGLKLSF
jgi:putative iron-regulated protein